MAIAQVEVKQGAKGGYASVIDLALIGITGEFIPVESSYERTVADLLVLQERSFTKPLRYDAESDQVLPDFILTDTAREVPLEVFGRDDAKYLARKDEKRCITRLTTVRMAGGVGTPLLVRRPQCHHFRLRVTQAPNRPERRMSASEGASRGPRKIIACRNYLRCFDKR